MTSTVPLAYIYSKKLVVGGSDLECPESNPIHSTVTSGGDTCEAESMTGALMQGPELLGRGRGLCPCSSTRITPLQDKGDRERVAQPGPRLLLKAITHNSQEQERIAVLWTIKHFRPNVAGRRFALVTDCSALTGLFRSRNLNPKLHRWALSLQEYDIDLRWRAGSVNLVPDCLSRLPHQTQTNCPISTIPLGRTCRSRTLV